MYRVSSTLNENEEKIGGKEDLKTLMGSLDETKEDASESEFCEKYSEIDLLSRPVL